MSKQKSSFVTVLIVAPLGVVMMGLSHFYPRVYCWALTVFGAMGFTAFILLLYRWLRQECREAIQPPKAALPDKPHKKRESKEEPSTPLRTPQSSGLRETPDASSRSAPLPPVKPATGSFYNGVSPFRGAKGCDSSLGKGAKGGGSDETEEEKVDVAAIVAEIKGETV